MVAVVIVEYADVVVEVYVEAFLLVFVFVY